MKIYSIETIFSTLEFLSHKLSTKLFLQVVYILIYEYIHMSVFYVIVNIASLFIKYHFF